MKFFNLKFPSDLIIFVSHQKVVFLQEKGEQNKDSPL